MYPLMDKVVISLTIRLLTLFTLALFAFGNSTISNVVPNNVRVPQWVLCLYVEPPPNFCKGLYEIDGKPFTKSSNNQPKGENVFIYPGLPPFFMPPFRQNPIGTESDDEFSEMIFEMLCSIMKPTPTWCTEISPHDDTNETQNICDEFGRNMSVPKWILCYLFKPPPVFCREYDEETTDLTGSTCYTGPMYSGIFIYPPFYPPYGPPGNIDGDEEYDIPWWILCTVIHPLPNWCPDVFRCDQPKHIDFPWWKLCTIMNPPPDECKYMTPPVHYTQVAENHSEWWVCLIIEPKPDWCEHVTYPPSKGKIETRKEFDYDSSKIINMDKEYPMWWMCVVIKPLPYWCKNATFPSDLDSPELVKEIKEGKRPYNFFLYCWWWLCEVFKPWAPWCKYLPPPPPELLEAFPESMPSDVFADFPLEDYIHILP